MSAATKSMPSKVKGDGSRASFDVAVIGAGQAGLAIGYFLARQGRRFVILDAGDSIAAAWRARWDSLVLFTPRRCNSLPGLAFPADPDGYPTRDEVIAYLERYAETFKLPIELNSAARSLTSGNGNFAVELDQRSIGADQVVVATGPFQTPRVPAFAGELAPEVFQTHSTGYRNPFIFPSVTTDAASTEAPWPRSLLVARKDGAAREIGRLAAGAPAPRAGYAHRPQSTRDQTTWGRPEAAGVRRLRANSHLRRWKHARR